MELVCTAITQVFCLEIYLNTLEAHCLQKCLSLRKPSLFLLGDKITDSKFDQLACIQYKNQNAVAHGYRDILRSP